MPHWFKPLLITTAISVALVASLMAAGLVYLRGDPARLEPVLEYVLSRVFNRQLVIGELLEAELDWDAYFLATDVSLANPAWADEEHFVYVQQLMIRLNLPSIWRDGPIIIQTLELTEPQLNLLAQETSSPSWDLWPTDDAGDAKSAHMADEEDDQAPTFPVLLLDARVTDGVLVYRDADQDVRATLSGLIAENPQDNLLQLDFNGDINTISFNLEGSAGPAQAILDGRGLSLDINGRWGQLTALAKGSFADLWQAQGPALVLEIEAPTSRALLDLLGMPEVRDGPLSFQASISQAGEAVSIQARGSLENFDLGFDATVDDLLTMDGVEMTFALAGPTLQELGYMFDKPGLPDTPFAVNGEAYRRGTVVGLGKVRAAAGDAQLSIDAALPEFPRIDNWSATIQGEGLNLALVAPLVGVTELPAVPYRVKGELKSDDDGVELVDFVLAGNNSSMALSGVVGEAPDFEGTRLSFSIKANDMALFGRTIGLANLPPESFDLSATFIRGDEKWRIDDGLFTSESLILEVNAQANTLLAASDFKGQARIVSPDLARTMEAYELEFEGLRGFPLEVDIKFDGSPDRLVIRKAVAVSGASRAELDGVIGDPVTLNGMSLNVTAKGPDLLEIFQLSDQAAGSKLPFEIAGSAARIETGFAFRQVKARLAGGDIELDGLLSSEPNYAGSAVSLVAVGENLRQVLGPLVVQEIPAERFNVQAELSYQPPLIQIETLQADIGGNLIMGQFDISGEGNELDGRGSVTVSGQSSHSLYQVLGLEFNDYLPDTNYSLQAQLKGDSDTLNVAPLILSFGKSDLSGTVALQFSPTLAVDADLLSEYLDLTFLVPDLEALDAQEVGATGSVAAVEDLTDELSEAELAERVIPDRALDFSWLQGLQASLSYHIKKVDLQPGAAAAMNLELDIRDSKLTLKEFDWDGAQAKGLVRATVQNTGATSDFDLYFDSIRLPLIWLLAEDIKRDGLTDYRLRLFGSGATVREVVASLDGAFAFRAGGGRMNNRGLDLFLGDILGEIFGSLVPTQESEPYTNLECHAGAMLFKKGVVELIPGLAFRTDKVDVVASGQINMRNEKLNVAFATRSRKGVGISVSKAITPYIKLGGNLANPQLAFDARGAAVSGGAAVATGGLSILAAGLWDRWIATSQNPCKVLYDNAEKDTRRAYKKILAQPDPALM